MLSMVVHSTNAKECALMEKLLKDLIAFYSEEELNIHLCSTLADLEQCVEKIDVLDLICLDIVQEGAVAAAERLRQRHKMAMMILVVDQSLSPINYIRPTILAAALLLRPVHPELARETLKEVLRNLRSNRDSDQENFVFSASGEAYHIPYSQIFYFESKDKKIFLRTAHREYGFYETMEHLQNILPKGFLRCHKSYIINTAFLSGLSFSKNLMFLQQDITVPLSRSYKDAVKAWNMGVHR